MSLFLIFFVSIVYLFQILCYLLKVISDPTIVVPVNEQNPNSVIPVNNRDPTSVVRAIRP